MLLYDYSMPCSLYIQARLPPILESTPSSRLWGYFAGMRQLVPDGDSELPRTGTPAVSTRMANAGLGRPYPGPVQSLGMSALLEVKRDYKMSSSGPAA